MKSLIKEIIGKEQRTISYSSPEDTLFKRVVINSIELSTGRGRIETAYERLRALSIDDHTIWDHIFPLLKINLDFNSETLEQLSVEGPLVVIANHPYGVADGLALGYILSKIRDDFLLIVNDVLCREEVLGKFFLPIEFRESKEAMRKNISTRHKALEKLSEGGAVGIFPSGGVSTTPKLFSRTAEDLEWKKFVIKLVRKDGVNVLPVFFHGQNSRSFQIASHIHPNFRLALLLNELDRLKHKSLRFVLGNPISSRELKSVAREDLLPFLKERTFALKRF